VPRFIPSDYSIDFTKFPPGQTVTTGARRALDGLPPLPAPKAVRARIR